MTEEIVNINAIPSKSFAHRAYICAMLAVISDVKANGSNNGDEIMGRIMDLIKCESESEDINATRRAVTSIVKGEDAIDVGESGSTLRFLIPVAAALGSDKVFITKGRLYERPLTGLAEELARHGTYVTREGEGRISVQGKLEGGVFKLPGDISSQFISGVLLALPLVGGEVELTTVLTSKKYVDITISVMKAFGVDVARTGKGFKVEEDLRYHVRNFDIEGDWSGAAFWLTAGAIGDRPVGVKGLSPDSPQGDIAIVDIINEFGGRCEWMEDKIVSYPSRLSAASIDIGDIPDLAPPIAVLAAGASGVSRMRNVGRLRLKESDRVAAIIEVLTSLGIGAYDADDEIIITGEGEGAVMPIGGDADSANDHRIVMMAAMLSIITSGKVSIIGSEAVRKSYPGFFDELEKVGYADNIERK